MTEPPFTSLEAMVQSIAEEIEPYLDRPFAVFGHSMGALISFELVRLIAGRHRLSPFHLFVAACQAPHLPDPYPPLHSLPDAELKAKLYRLNGTPAGVLDDSKLVQLLLPVLRADLEATETYSYQRGLRLSCPITVFGGLQEKRISRDLLYAWQEHTSSSCTLRMLPGDHFFIQSAQNLLLRVVSRETSNCFHPVVRQNSVRL
jgi:medium-chain acyl-[acyl-carrier-protein] hydrolase